MIYIVDTHSWIEYFKGSKQGFVLRKLLENNENKFVTMECSLSELKGFCLRENADTEDILGTVLVNSFVFPVLREHWLAAARIKHEMRKKRKDFGLIDAILFAKQKEIGGKVVSGDPHFKDRKEVLYTGKK